MNFLKTDFKRAFGEPSFILALSLNALILALSAVVILSGGSFSGDDLFKKSQSLILPFIAPVLAALPYACMIMTEKDTGYRTLMLSQLGERGYELRRLWVCGVMSGTALFAPQAALFAVCFFIGVYHDPLNILLGAAMGFPFGFAFGTLSFALTFFNRLKYIPLVAPQVIYLLLTYAFPHLGLSEFYPPLGVSPWIYGEADFAALFSVLGITALFSFAAVFLISAHIRARGET